MVVTWVGGGVGGGDGRCIPRGNALALPAEPFMTKLFADNPIPDVILTWLTIFILAPLNGKTLSGGIFWTVSLPWYRGRGGWGRG
ncbi:hypothetical protein KCA24_34785 [Escherichia coli]|nr:hypothetical protein [Escherichia coli]